MQREAHPGPQAGDEVGEVLRARTEGTAFASIFIPTRPLDANCLP